MTQHLVSGIGNRLWLAKRRFMVLATLLFILDLSFSTLNTMGQDFVNRSLAEYRTPDKDIVLVTIDDESLAGLFNEWGKWPWDRSIHAFLLEQMSNAGARVVGYDILFSHPDPQRADGDAYFNEVISISNKSVQAMAVLSPDQAGSGAVIQDFIKKEGRRVGFIRTEDANPDARVSLDLPWAIHSENWQLGAVNFFGSQNGTGRHYPVFLNTDGWKLPSLATAMMRIGNPEVFREFNPIDDNQFIINWQSISLLPYKHYKYLELYQWFNSGDEAAFKAAFEHKYVLVGATASGLFDARPTVIAQFQPGLSIHATALDNLKTGNFYKSQTGLIFFGWLSLVVLMLLIGRASFIHKIGLSILIWTVSAMLSLLLAFYLAWNFYLLLDWLPLVVALGIVIVINLFLESWQVYLQNIRTLDTFSRFMEPKIVKLLSRQKKLSPSALTKRCELSVLFTDIRGFTTLSESRSAEEIIEFLNQYFAGQVAQIFHHKGTFDKYIGDAIMAFWGAPVADNNHADHAVACGLAMLDELEKFKQSIGVEGETFDIGIGIHSGPAVVGMLGSSQRYDYTAIGDTVNVASRIEGQTKNRAHLLISSDTRDLLTTNYQFVSHGMFQLKGRNAEVELFEVIQNQEIIES